MAKYRPEGMMMSPNNGGGIPTGGRKRPPTGETSSLGGLEENGGKRDLETNVFKPDIPIEVVFKAETFRKLIVWTLGPMMITLIGAISAFFYFYHKTSVHLDDPGIHLARGERDKLESKIEAKTERKKLKKEIITHFDVKVREIKVEQREQVEKIGRKLRSEQRSNLNKILSEVKKARQDIRSH
jgi:ribosomal protein L23